ncbi:hypothetical protein NBRC10512_006274 [Rhodotorula toruloides]|uniref:RHTO0S05e02366g1_1 n=2 Tax=Rhodotorula toruloides TaxID=5286 RepID=A0A061AY95_RHOTO|nr:uncharacterized protein RHTO_02435 [Rhodotorula toruloides NP11]EMS20819.1 hypothetical protein RHTO_02435 [Rhodotorula toruloides NP11]CDR40364.1 RHTO0S05e02366g1_1 [Rhodotorula toruloides]
MAADAPPPLSFILGSVWPGYDEYDLVRIKLMQLGIDEGFPVEDLPLPTEHSHWNRLGRGRPFHFGCCYEDKDSTAPPPCTFRVVLEPRVVEGIPRTVVTRVNTQHNHEARLGYLDRMLHKLEEETDLKKRKAEVRDRALDRLDHIKKSWSFRVTSVDPPTRWELDAAFGEQNMILDTWEKMFGKASFDDLVEAAKEKLSLFTQNEHAAALAQMKRSHDTFILRTPPVTPPKRTPPRQDLPTPTPVAYQSPSATSPVARIKREAAPEPLGQPERKTPRIEDDRAEAAPKEKKVVVIDLCDSDSEGEDVKPAIQVGPATPTEATGNAAAQDVHESGKTADPKRPEIPSDLADFLRSLSCPFPIEKHVHLFARPSIEVDSPQQLRYIASRENGALDELLEELGKDVTRDNGIIEKGMPRVWRSALRDELKRVARDE